MSFTADPVGRTGVGTPYAAANGPAPTQAAPATAGGNNAAGAGAPGGTSLDDILRTEHDQYLSDKQAVINIQRQVANAQATVDQLNQDPNADPQQVTAATRNLDVLYSSYASMNNNLAHSSEALAAAAVKASDSRYLQPSQIAEANALATKAQADSALATAQADQITRSSGAQRALVVAQGQSAQANADLSWANAGHVTAITPATISQLQASADESQARAKLYGAQAGQTTAETAKTAAETPGVAAQSQIAQAQAGVAPRAAEATTGTLEANRGIAETNRADLPSPGEAKAARAGALGQVNAQTGLIGAQTLGAAAQAGLTGAETAKTTAETANTALGPLANVQSKVDAIKQIQNMVFGPGGSGNVDDANKMLQQYLQATVAGTTPAELAKEAGTEANQQYATGQQGYATQSGLAGNKAAAFTGAANSAFSTLADMNKYAPPGSTAGAAAYQAILNDLQGRLQNAPVFNPGPPPKAPGLPSMLQQYMPGGNGPAPPAAGAPVPAMPPPGSMPPAAAASPLPAPGPQNATPEATGGGHTITINIGGVGGGGTNTSSGSSQVPGILAPQQPADVDFLHKLWGNELGSGAVTSPFNAANAGGVGTGAFG